MVTTDIAAFRPYAVSQFKSRDAAAAVLLANSLGWRIIHRDNGPVALIAEDGKQINVPDNTGIKMDVFRGWIHQIAVHTPNLSIDRKLVDQIVKATKINRDHARLMYDLAEDALPDDYGPVTEPEVFTASDGEAAIRLPKGTEPFILTREPYKRKDGRETGVCYVRTWSDDHVDYECVICGAVFNNIKAVGSHRQWHIGRGEVPGKQIKHRPGSKFQRSYEPVQGRRSRASEPPDEAPKMIEVAEDVMTDAIAALRVLDQIRQILGADEVSALKVDLAHKQARIELLEGNLRALREMLSEDM